MLPTLAVLTALRTAFTAYITAQLTAPGWNLLLLKAPFVPSPDLVLADVVIDTDLATFPNAIEAAGSFAGRDPANGDLVTLYSSGSGAEVQVSGSAATRTWYGFAIGVVATDVILASELLPVPLVALTDEDEVRNPEIGFHLPLNLIR
jgi:hypothetical protein